MSYLATFFSVLVGLYTGLFALENWKEKNYSGAVAIILLALVEIGLPFYMLYFK